MSNDAAPAPRTFDVLVDTGTYGLMSFEVEALTYYDAYKGAVEALLLDYDGTVVHALNSRLQECYGS